MYSNFEEQYQNALANLDILIERLKKQYAPVKAELDRLYDEHAEVLDNMERIAEQEDYSQILFKNEEKKLDELDERLEYIKELDEFYDSMIYTVERERNLWG